MQLLKLHVVHVWKPIIVWMIYARELKYDHMYYFKWSKRFYSWFFFFTENVALHKPAYQTNPYRKDNDSFDASNAVDGLKSNLAWSGGQCAVSALEKETATLWVDLGSIYSIHHITLYYRTDNTDWGKINLSKVLLCIFLTVNQ